MNENDRRRIYGKIQSPFNDRREKIIDALAVISVLIVGCAVVWFFAVAS